MIGDAFVATSGSRYDSRPMLVNAPATNYPNFSRLFDQRCDDLVLDPAIWTMAERIGPLDSTRLRLKESEHPRASVQYNFMSFP